MCIDEAKWMSLMAEANAAARFRWCPSCAIWAVCCFIPLFCLNQHNKNVQPYMQALVDKWDNGELPSGISVSYEMATGVETT